VNNRGNIAGKGVKRDTPQVVSLSSLGSIPSGLRNRVGFETRGIEIGRRPKLGDCDSSEFKLLTVSLLWSCPICGQNQLAKDRHPS
jgi:hypothetical protein